MIDNILEYAIIFIILIAIFVAIMAIAAWPTMLLWNWLMPDIFGLKQLTFWQTLGLMILSTMFFYRPSSSNSK